MTKKITGLPSLYWTITLQDDWHIYLCCYDQTNEFYRGDEMCYVFRLISTGNRQLLDEWLPLDTLEQHYKPITKEAYKLAELLYGS